MTAIHKPVVLFIAVSTLVGMAGGTGAGIGGGRRRLLVSVQGW